MPVSAPAFAVYIWLERIVWALPALRSQWNWDAPAGWSEYLPFMIWILGFGLRPGQNSWDGRGCLCGCIRKYDQHFRTGARGPPRTCDRRRYIPGDFMSDEKTAKL